MGLQKRFNLTAASSSALGGVLADPAKDTDTIPCRIKDGKLYITPKGGGDPFVLKAATLAALGGIKAGPKTEADTVVAHIGEDQQLYVPAPTVPNMPHMQVVSYVGTGTFGKDNPCVIHVNFEIKSIISLNSIIDGRNDCFINMPGMSAVTNPPLNYKSYFGFYYYNPQRRVAPLGKISKDKKTFYWYITGDYANADTQFNLTNGIYYFLVIG